MPKHITWNDLHDATLQKITMVWATGSLEIALSSFFAPAIVIEAKDVIMLTLPKRHPWGASQYINEVRFTCSATGIDQLEIEVQSGDTIAIQAAAFSLTATP